MFIVLLPLCISRENDVRFFPFVLSGVYILFMLFIFIYILFMLFIFIYILFMLFIFIFILFMLFFFIYILFMLFIFIYILSVLFIFIYLYWCSTRFPHQVMLVSFISDTTGFNCGASIANPSGAPKLSPGLQWGSYGSHFSFLCIVL